MSTYTTTCVLGACSLCGKLVAIVPRGLRFGSDRQRNYYPVAHDRPQGGPCAGASRSIE